MIKSIAKIYARQIHRGNKSLSDISNDDLKTFIKEAYLEIYKVELTEE